MSMLKNVALLLVGAGVGSVITYKAVKDKYEARIDEEVKSVKDAFADLYDQRGDHKSENDEAEEDDELVRKARLAAEARHKKSIKDYSNIIKNNGYSEEKENENIMSDKPYIIDGDEFGELDYEETSLTFYADGILADDEDDEVIDDVSNIIGDDTLAMFEAEGVDTMYIRNDSRMTDYEVTRDLRTYEEVCGTNVYGIDVGE